MKKVDGSEMRAIFGDNLRRIRTDRQLSLLKLSSLTGLTHNFIHDIEKYRRWISPDTIAKLASALKAEPYEFFVPSESGDVFNTYLAVELTNTVEQVVSDFRQRYSIGAEQAKGKHGGAGEKAANTGTAD